MDVIVGNEHGKRLAAPEPALRIPPVAPIALLGFYLIGGAMVAGGIYVISHGAFPSWIGVAVLAFGFGPFAPAAAIGALRVLAGVGVAAGSVLFVYSTWISRRPQAPSLPPRP